MMIVFFCRFHLLKSSINTVIILFFIFERIQDTWKLIILKRVLPHFWGVFWVASEHLLILNGRKTLHRSYLVFKWRKRLACLLKLGQCLLYVFLLCLLHDVLIIVLSYKIPQVLLLYRNVLHYFVMGWWELQLHLVSHGLLHYVLVIIIFHHFLWHSIGAEWTTIHLAAAQVWAIGALNTIGLWFKRSFSLAFLRQHSSH